MCVRSHSFVCHIRFVPECSILFSEQRPYHLHETDRSMLSGGSHLIFIVIYGKSAFSMQKRVDFVGKHQDYIKDIKCFIEGHL